SQRMRHPWSDGGVSLRGGQSALSERRIIIAMDQVVNDTRMIGVVFPKFFEDGGCLELFRQACVVGRRVAYRQNRESVERLGFEIVRILVAKLMHRFFVGNDTVARSDRTMTRLPNRACART